jgi:hypothetical protein
MSHHHLDAMACEPPVSCGDSVGKREQPGTEGSRLVALVESLVHAKEDLVGQVFEIVLMNAKMSEAVPHVRKVFLEDGPEVRPNDRRSGLHN